MYPAYTQLVAKWSSPSICDARATGCDVLYQLLLYIVHVKSGAAESQDGEGHLYDMLVRVLQHCHYL